MALTDNLVSYYKFDNATTDELGTNDLTNNGATYTASGKINGAYSYDADYMVKANPTGLPTGATLRTFSVWYKRTAGAATSGGIICFRVSSGQTFEFLEYVDGGEYIFTDGVNAGNNCTYTDFWEDGVWIHAVLVLTAANTFKLYKNGVDVTASTSLNGIFGVNINTGTINNLYIGTRDGGTSNARGVIDEVGIWDRALSSTEVSELYNGGAGFEYPFVIDPPVASFSADVTSGYPPLTVTFTDTSTESPTSWSWEKDNVVFSTDQNPVESFGLGTFDIKLTATNAGGSDSEEKLDYITTTAKPITILPMSGTKHRFSNTFKYMKNWKFKFL